MRFDCRISLPILYLSSFLLSHPAKAAPEASDPSASSDTFPQIVRLSYVQGDVRIARGKDADKLHDKQVGQATGWEQAGINTPLASGYNLVTGNGRAEIELEDASVIYLGENSVVSFDELSSTGGVPYTAIALLSGTATLNVKLQWLGERFLLRTPSDTVWLAYPQKAYVRVDSFLDMTAVTPQRDLTFHTVGLAAPREQMAGQTFAFRSGHRVPLPSTYDPASFTSWDKWVAEQVNAHDAIVSATMKQAGLTAPIPGLAGMSGKGKFFSCEPYGTCWEPTNGWNDSPEQADASAKPTFPETAANQSVTAASAAVPPSASTPSSKKQKQNAADVFLASHPGAIFYTEDYTFPCMDYPVRDLIARDPVTGQLKVIDSYFADDPFFDVAYSSMFSPWGMGTFWGYRAYWNRYPWDWAVCHAGSWIRWNHRYVWVAGGKRHHRCPVRWVKNGRRVGYVPIHPRDQRGKSPLNLKNGLFTIADKKHGFEKVEVETGKLKLLDKPPREFRKAELQPLKLVEAPHPVAHNMLIASNAARIEAPVTEKHGTIAQPGHVARAFAAREQGTPINFDRKSRSFTVSRQVISGGRASTVVQPLSVRGGNFQSRGFEGAARSRSSAFGGGNGHTGNYSGGGNASRGSGRSFGGGGSHNSAPAGGSGSFHGGAPSGGGGGSFHGGGGSSGGGGGGASHGGGGGGGGTSSAGGGGGGSHK